MPGNKVENKRSVYYKYYIYEHLALTMEVQLTDS